MYLQPVAALIPPQKCRHLLCGFKAYNVQQHLLLEQITFLGFLEWDVEGKNQISVIYYFRFRLVNAF